MQPISQILDNSLRDQIIDEAVRILCTLGVEVRNQEVIDLLVAYDVRKANGSPYLIFNEEHIDQAIKSAPSSFGLYDQYGDQVTHFKDANVHFTPGSSALKFYDTYLRSEFSRLCSQGCSCRISIDATIRLSCTSYFNRNINSTLC